MFLMMATEQGQIKKTDLMAYSHPRKGGISAINLKKGDALIGCKLTDGNQEIFMATREGKAIRFSEQDVRSIGRTASGVRGISLAKKDAVIAMDILKKDTTLLTVAENGYGKRTNAEAYRLQSRGGKGIINIKTSTRNGLVIGVTTVLDEDELILITSSGMIVRCQIKDIRPTGRSTQGVRLLRTKGTDKVVAVAKFAVKDEEDNVQAT